MQVKYAPISTKKIDGRIKQRRQYSSEDEICARHVICKTAVPQEVRAYDQKHRNDARNVKGAVARLFHSRRGCG